MNNNNMNDKELTVKKIEKLSSEKNSYKLFKFDICCCCAYSIYSGLRLLPASLGGAIFCFTIVALLGILYNNLRDTADKIEKNLDKEKSKITYDEYKMYHEQPKVIKKVKQLYNSVKDRNKRGFASSSQTSNTRI